MAQTAPRFVNRGSDVAGTAAVRGLLQELRDAAVMRAGAATGLRGRAVLAGDGVRPGGERDADEECDERDGSHEAPFARSPSIPEPAPRCFHCVHVPRALPTAATHVAPAQQS